MNTYERALEDQKVTWPTHVTMVWNAGWGSLWLKILGWSPAQPCNHRDTSNAHPVLSKTSPPLGPIHRNPHRGNMRRTTISDALLLLPAGISQKKFNASACVLHCLCAYVFVSECRRWGVGGNEMTGVAVQMSSQPLAPDEWQLLWWWRGNELEAFPTHHSHLNDWNSTQSKRQVSSLETK